MAPMEGLALRAVALAAVALALLAAPAVAAQQAGALDPGYGNGGRVVLSVGDNAQATAFALQPDDGALLGGPALFDARSASPSRGSRPRSQCWAFTGASDGR
jgi:hypothetical protein